MVRNLKLRQGNSLIPSVFFQSLNSIRDHHQVFMRNYAGLIRGIDSTEGAMQKIQQRTEFSVGLSHIPLCRYIGLSRRPSSIGISLGRRNEAFRSRSIGIERTLI